MKFVTHDEQKTVTINEAFWQRAFNYAVKELQVEYHHAEVDCFFIPHDVERHVKFKGNFQSGATGLSDRGAWFYIATIPVFTKTDVATMSPEKKLVVGTLLEEEKQRMVTTFFHEMTHVKQLLVGELISKPRGNVWKGEKYHKREYSFSPWEKEAEAFEKKAYDCFLKKEVAQIMATENANAYTEMLKGVFPDDDVFRVTQEIHWEREKCAPAASSERDWLMLAS